MGCVPNLSSNLVICPRANVPLIVPHRERPDRSTVKLDHTSDSLSRGCRVRQPPDQQRESRCPADPHERLERGGALHGLGEAPVGLSALVVGMAAEAVNEQYGGLGLETLAQDQRGRGTMEELITKLRNVHRVKAQALAQELKPCWLAAHPRRVAEPLAEQTVQRLARFRLD